MTILRALRSICLLPPKRPPPPQLPLASLRGTRYISLVFGTHGPETFLAHQLPFRYWTSAMSVPAPSVTASKSEANQPSQIYLVSYPKIIFLYPTFVAAIIAGITMLFNVGEATSHLVSLVFLAIFATNLAVMAFDFPRTTSLTLFFFLVAVGIGLWSLFKFNPNLLPAVTNVIQRLNPEANATFYFTLVTAFSLIYIAIMVTRQFDYWEVRPNELLHHHGFMSDLKRYSAPNLRIEKEITDVFEFMLLGAGRLILHPSSEPRAIVLENVINIDRKEMAITKMLGALQVRVAPPNEEA